MNEWPDTGGDRVVTPRVRQIELDGMRISAAEGTALALLVAAWKIDNAFSLFEAGEIDIDLLYAAPLEQRDWRQVYAAELSAHPELAADLSPERRQGDGIELVLERAQLRDNERWVVRDYLSGKSIELISEDSGWKAQSLQNLLNNGLARLRGLVQATDGGRPAERGVVISKGAGRSRRGHVSGSPAASAEAHRASPSGRGSGSGGLREVRAEAAPAHAQRFPAAQLDVHGDEAPEHRLMAAFG